MAQSSLLILLMGRLKDDSPPAVVIQGHSKSIQHAWPRFRGLFLFSAHSFHPRSVTFPTPISSPWSNRSKTLRCGNQKKGGEIAMSEKDAGARKDFSCFFGNMSCADMMRGVMGGKKNGFCCSRAETMSERMQKCCPDQGRKEDARNDEPDREKTKD
jgi:hypothetical protein